MLDLYDFFGTFSVGMAAKDLNPENPMDSWILEEIKKEASEGDSEAIRFLNNETF